MDALEDHDDVEAVYANFDIPDAVLEAVSALSRIEPDGQLVRTRAEVIA